MTASSAYHIAQVDPLGGAGMTITPKTHNPEIRPYDRVVFWLHNASDSEMTAVSISPLPPLASLLSQSTN